MFKSEKPKTVFATCHLHRRIEKTDELQTLTVFSFKLCHKVADDLVMKFEAKNLEDITAGTV